VASEFGIPCVQKPFALDHLLAAMEATFDNGVRPVIGPTASGMRRRIDANAERGGEDATKRRAR
jgi:hypothetical protein